MPLKMSAKETSLAFSINVHPPQYLLWGAENFFFFFLALLRFRSFLSQRNTTCTLNPLLSQILVNKLGQTQ